MAMCEELDQTVTDLTDELHNKVGTSRIIIPAIGYDSHVIPQCFVLTINTQSMDDGFLRLHVDAASTKTHFVQNIEEND